MALMREALMREALEFYATPDNWRRPPAIQAQIEPGQSAIEKDRGQKAQDALTD